MLMNSFTVFYFNQQHLTYCLLHSLSIINMVYHGYYVLISTFLLNFCAIGVFNSAGLYLEPLSITFPSGEVVHQHYIVLYRLLPDYRLHQLEEYYKMFWRNEILNCQGYFLLGVYSDDWVLCQQYCIYINRCISWILCNGYWFRTWRKYSVLECLLS